MFKDYRMKNFQGGFHINPVCNILVRLRQEEASPGRDQGVGQANAEVRGKRYPKRYASGGPF